ncbi:testis-specific gene 10 protein [Hypomesus transpacificus]|uniref:testis-specific gene 10 protein n=1 Tax=Hypomesus transpacificus TaxID=137520 RepID=UPI001F0873A4|nr:testis-specific gene 10 protein [Hypomesus transpacificus]XP_046887446.1 testis-specific gene 10 protein [Hypomesus transpacificus]XP_046887447.1 testis-specific gene 10 protein [Hypomesus transpacificus]
MLRDRRCCSPSRGPSSSRSPTRHSPVKSGSYDCELMRVLRERDDMQSMLDKYERHLSEVQANVKVLSADRDKTSMHYQKAQEEIAALRREVIKSKSTRVGKGCVTAQSILKRVEAERDEAVSDLHRMSTERDSLRERLKISQETAINERAHLEQRVEDLQKTILTLEQERGDQLNKLSLMRDTVMRLEEELHCLDVKLAVSQEELGRARNESGMLRLSNTQTETALSDSQRRLTSRIGELQKVQERNRQLEEKNDSLLRQMCCLREEVGGLQSTIADLDLRRDSLHERLEKKSDLLVEAQNQLENKDVVIGSLRQNVEELDGTTQCLRDSLTGREREVEVLRQRLGDAGEELGAVAKVKDATLRENAMLREDLERARMDGQALQLRAEDSSQEVQNLHRKVQEYMSDISRIESLLAVKESECREQQEARRRVSAQAESWEEQARQAEGSLSQLRADLLTSDRDRLRLKDRVEGLETSLQEALLSERSCSSQLAQLSRSLQQKEEELRQVQDQHSSSYSDLEKIRELCVKLDASKESVQRELEACSSEVETLRKQLASERLSVKSLEAMLVSSREKELHRQLSSQEKHSQVHLLRDKLTVADSRASCQSREVAQLKTRSAQLEADLEMTKRQLSTERFERERAVLELRRQGLSSSSSGLRASPHPRRSTSPRVSWSPERPYRHSPPDHLGPDPSPERSLGF